MLRGNLFLVGAEGSMGSGARFPLSVYLRKLATVAVAAAASGGCLLACDQCVARCLEGKMK